MRRLNFGIWMAFLFLFGLLAGLNIATMYPSGGYMAAWWKVAVAVTLAAWFGVMAWKTKR